MIMELEDKDERTFEDFLAFLQLHPELKTWEIGPEPILSLPGLQIYPDRRKIYHGQQEIELNTKEYLLMGRCMKKSGRKNPLATNISRWAAMSAVCGRNYMPYIPNRRL